MEVSDLLSRIEREWDIRASRFEAGRWRELRSEICALQLYAGLFALIGLGILGVPLTLLWLSRAAGANPAPLPTWLARFIPGMWWVIAAMVFSAPEFAEESIFNQADAILRAHGVLPAGPAQGASPPTSVLALRLLLGAQVISRITNLLVHVAVLLAAVGYSVYGLDRFLKEGSIRDLLGLIVVLLIVLVIRQARKR